jgi:hypothetical protein
MSSSTEIIDEKIIQPLFSPVKKYLSSYCPSVSFDRHDDFKPNPDFTAAMKKYHDKLFDENKISSKI